MDADRGINVVFGGPQAYGHAVALGRLPRIAYWGPAGGSPPRSPVEIGVWSRIAFRGEGGWGK